MHRELIFLLGTCLVFTGCRLFQPAVDFSGRTLEDYQKQAERFASTLALPDFETSPEAVRQSMTNAIAEANASLDRIGALDPKDVSFENTMAALDDIAFLIATTANRIFLFKETSEHAAIREASIEMIKWYEEWSVGLDYREDVYAAVRAYADQKPRLKGEDRKLFDEILRDYRRAGLHLPKPERAEVERLRKELARRSTDFDSNVTKAQQPVVFTREDLEGVPESFLNQTGVRTGENEYTVMANITWHFVTVMENAKNESTRRRLKTARYSLAQHENIGLLQQILEIRDRVAKKLGYATWADYQIEIKMAKTASRAHRFVRELSTGLQPKFDQELAEFRAFKIQDTGDANATVEIWDWRYYSNQLKKERYNVDTEQLRVFFPYQRVLDGMFEIYESIFRLRIEPVDPPYKWTEELKMFVISDSKTAQPLGMLYLDMFPREGKYNHFAQFGLVDGKLLANGIYQRPTVALICNFPPPEPDSPSLLSHQDVETLFHEFGHALHSILTQAKYVRFSGTSVPRDFVEAPSQMLENWVWNKEVLDSFASDYRNPDRKIPEEILAKLKEAKLATIGTFYRRQLAMALLDLALHTDVHAGSSEDIARFSNQILTDHFLPVPEGTAFIAYFGHLTGYDAGYYGYAWADAIAADLATAFEAAQDGYYDQEIGMRLRDEIYAPGGSRDVNISIERFLGRAHTIDAFLQTLGMGPSAAPQLK